MSPPREADALPELRCTPLSALLPGWLALPADKAHALVRRAEAFHDTLEPEATYPLDFVAFKLTGFRRDYGDTALLFGVPLAADLAVLIDAITRRHPMPGGADDVRGVQAWAEALSVHPRTLRRWRDAGLRWRWITDENRKQPILGHTRAAIDAFRSRQPQRFEKAQQFTPLNEEDKRLVLERAESIAATASERSVSSVAEQIANEVGRAHETIRLLLLRHAQRRADAAEHRPMTRRFPKLVPGLTPKQRRQAVRERRRGVSLRELGRRVGKSGPTLHRWLSAFRAAVLRRLRLDHVASPLFDRSDASEVYLRGTLPEPTQDPTRGHGELLEGLPLRVEAIIRRTHRWDEATRRSAWLRMNYLKHAAQVTREALPESDGIRAKELDHAERCVREAGEIRRQLVRGELAYLVSLLRRQASSGLSASSPEFAKLFADGLAVLVDAIDSYNASGNRRFETYFRNRLQRALAPRVGALRETGETGDTDEDARRRAVRRNAPTVAERVWEPVVLDLLRWAPDAEFEYDDQDDSADAQDASA